MRNEQGRISPAMEVLRSVSEHYRLTPPEFEERAVSSLLRIIEAKVEMRDEQRFIIKNGQVISALGNFPGGEQIESFEAWIRGNTQSSIAVSRRFNHASFSFYRGQHSGTERFTAGVDGSNFRVNFSYSRGILKSVHQYEKEGSRFVDLLNGYDTVARARFLGELLNAATPVPNLQAATTS